MLCRGQGPNLGKVILCPRTVSETLCRHGNDWLYNDCRLRSHCLCVHLLLVYFNCFHRILLSLCSREKKEKAWQATGNVIRLVDEKEYKMDYLQLNRMTEDRTEWRRWTQDMPNDRIPKEEVFWANPDRCRLVYWPIFETNWIVRNWSSTFCRT